MAADESASAPPEAIRIEGITVYPGRIVCELVVHEAYPRYTTPELAESLCARFPSLPLHACKNNRGTTFAAVMGHTSIPHLFEHLVIDLQTHDEAGPYAGSPERGRDEVVYVGTTEWLEENVGKARVEVSFTDDLNALRAFNRAAATINEAMGEYMARRP